jgi:hypothetical protein
MKKLIHELSTEELIQDLSERNTTLQCDLVAEIESNRQLRNEKDNLKLQLKKADEHGWVAGLIIVLLLVCTVTFGILYSKSEQALKVVNSYDLYPKAVKLIDKHNVDKIRLENHLVLEKMNRKEQKEKIDLDREMRLNENK